jgi:N6-L-threonylcarbamoyladenine synthase
MLILGIDTSCDDTSAALVEDGTKIIAGRVASSVDLHRDFGGIVPEIACRSHIRDIVPVIDATIRQSGRSLKDIDAVAVTNRPGLVGALLIGLNAAKTLAYVLGAPLIALDHVSSHIYSIHMENPSPQFPYVALVVSGGHTHLYHCTSHFEHRLVGKTLDDAAGEAFDKVSAILNLGYPGGPNIERAAKDAGRGPLHLKRTYLGGESLDFSFSGIKTAVLYHVRGQDAGQCRRIRRRRKVAPTRPATPREIAAEFQEAVVEVLVAKLIAAARKYKVPAVTVGGGVAANERLREAVAEACRRAGLACFFPSKSLCTDNAAMVAGLGYHYAVAGRHSPLDIDAMATSW